MFSKGSDIATLHMILKPFDGKVFSFYAFVVRTDGEWGTVDKEELILQTCLNISPFSDHAVLTAGWTRQNATDEQAFLQTVPQTVLQDWKAKSSGQGANGPRAGKSRHPPFFFFLGLASLVTSPSLPLSPFLALSVCVPVYACMHAHTNTRPLTSFHLHVVCTHIVVQSSPS